MSVARVDPAMHSLWAIPNIGDGIAESDATRVVAQRPVATRADMNHDSLTRAKAWLWVHHFSFRSTVATSVFRIGDSPASMMRPVGAECHRDGR